MNILYRVEQGRPVIRIVDFESSYDVARHASGVFYNPPTTPGFCAPEVHDRAPDGRADVFSLGAVLYTMMAGYGWTWESQLFARIEADTEIDAELRAILQTASRPDADSGISRWRICALPSRPIWNRSGPGAPGRVCLARDRAESMRFSSRPAVARPD